MIWSVVFTINNAHEMTNFIQGMDQYNESYLSTVVYSELSQIFTVELFSKIVNRLNAVNYFHRNLQLRCLTGFCFKFLKNISVRSRKDRKHWHTILRLGSKRLRTAEDTKTFTRKWLRYGTFANHSLGYGFL